jgi:hypothetical protein
MEPEIEIRVEEISQSELIEKSYDKANKLSDLLITVDDTGYVIDVLTGMIAILSIIEIIDDGDLFMGKELWELSGRIWKEWRAANT